MFEPTFVVMVSMVVSVSPIVVSSVFRDTSSVLITGPTLTLTSVSSVSE